MERPRLVREETRTLADARFLKLYDYAYEEGRHYYVASRRGQDDLIAFKTAEELRRELPDAVSCCLVLDVPGEEPRMVLFYEYRYPTGQYLLSIPSGLIDASDRDRDEPLVSAMAREIGEECGLQLGEGDDIWVINPLLFNTPGMTDESTALLCAVARHADSVMLSQAGAEGSECFDGFELLTKEEVWQVLHRGCDPNGIPYPMVAWAAMTFFATDQWKARRA